MITYKKIVQKAYYNDLGEETMWKITDMTDKFVESIRATHPAEVDKFLAEIKHAVCHAPLTEELAKKYVAEMDNKDGSKGGHWTLEQTREFQKTHPEYASLNDLDFYVALNMMYSDYYKSTRTLDTYAALAKDFVDDRDAPSDKVRRYMEAMRD